MRKNVQKAHEITDAKISFVSLVDKAANKRSFILKKAEDGKANFITYGRIVKADSDTHYVTGIVYEPMEEDAHGDYMTEDEIVKAAYWFSKNGNKVDLQHSFVPLEGASVVENWIAKTDFDIDGEAIKKGTWLMTVEVTDQDVWQGIEKGEITGFSMGGLGSYSEEDVNLDDIQKSNEQEKRGIFKKLAGLLGFDVVEKGAVADDFAEKQKANNFWAAFSTLENALSYWDSWDKKTVFTTDEDAVKEALTDFTAIVQSVLVSDKPITKQLAIADNKPVKKAGRKMSGKNKEALKSIYESLGTFLKEFDDITDEPDDDDNQDNKKSEKEEQEVTKEEARKIALEAVKKAFGGEEETKGKKTEGEDEEDEEAEKNGKKVEKSEALTAENIQKMVEAAIEKAMKPVELPAVLETTEPVVTAEQVQTMITEAVAKAVDPILKSRGLPSQLDSNVAKDAGSKQHYLHGVL